MFVPDLLLRLAYDLLARPGANVMKLFTAVNYNFLRYAGVFVRLDWKSLPMKTLAYHENL